MLLPPILQFAGPSVVRVDKDLAVLITTIKAFAVVVGYPGPTQRQHSSRPVVSLLGILSPKTDLNAQVAFVSDNNISAVLDSPTLFDVHLGKSAHINYHAYCVYRAHLLKVIDFFDRREAKAAALNAKVVVNFFNFRLLVEDNRVVVLYTCVFLVCHFDLAVCKQVNLVFNQNLVVVVCLLVEESTLDLGPLIVNQLNI